ncbi:hypothetical protein COT94_00360 [Candidatus Falkowbacteria bacterium CG10_big_fil_rev_8_21_14_0_10_37_14]|uniref:Polymerase nucleotidyl transferase domain-containing protein n=1 Tax=Candidatus Falkowbacteria bacterium CG10_big_fil_rev_8_21_14_0_10_37_14 TaxID=1974561 RepID=A0A2M6WUI8_9BACT|nr:hypothetical protein [Candidatus Falkowbacteria bacterium]PIT96401.1 MAG: hypothetical protein COT94_00360 [Candidatus Falkowbacteria bacterium CG10_big_fil_rev_8_21_14_0_10_37_14]
MDKRIEKLKQDSAPILSRYDVKKSAVFGSYARGDYKKNSDIDLLIEFKKNAGGLLAMVNLKRDLEVVTKRVVDLGTFKSLNKRVKKYVENDLIKIYG